MAYRYVRRRAPPSSNAAVAPFNAGAECLVSTHARATGAKPRSRARKKQLNSGRARCF